MKHLKIAIIVLLAYFVTSLLWENFTSFSGNFGSFWFNIKYFYLWVIGYALGLIALYSKLILKIFMSITGLFLILLLMDSPSSVSSHSFITYLFLVSLFILIFCSLGSFGFKTKHEPEI